MKLRNKKTTMSPCSTSDDDTSYEDIPPKKSKKTYKVLDTYRIIRDTYTKAESSYYNELSESDKEYVLKNEAKIRGDKNLVGIPIRFKIIYSKMNNSTKALLLNKIDKFNKMTPEQSEYHKLKNWIDNISMIPFDVYCDIPVSKSDPVDRILDFMNRTKTILDNTVYGHIEAKLNIQRIIAQWISNPSSHGYCIGIHGPPGIGKTCLIKHGLSKALGLPFGFVALGGASDGSYLDGHNYTYEGSSYGKIVEVLMKSKCMNPIIFFDELDKISTSYKGDEVIGILTHLTDISQNDNFTDRYFSEVSLNLSRSLMIFSYNNASVINPILKDRMITIEVKGYKNKEKLTIARDYLIPSILETFKIDKDNIVISDEMIEKIISMVSAEEGVRNLKRGIETVISWINMYTYTREVDISYPFIVKSDFVEKHIIMKNEKDTAMINRMYL